MGHDSKQIVCIIITLIEIARLKLYHPELITFEIMSYHASQ